MHMYIYLHISLSLSMEGRKKRMGCTEGRKEGKGFSPPIMLSSGPRTAENQSFYRRRKEGRKEGRKDGRTEGRKDGRKEVSEVR